MKGKSIGIEWILRKLSIKIWKDGTPIDYGTVFPSLLGSIEGIKRLWIDWNRSGCTWALETSHSICYKHDQNTDETYAVIMSVKYLFYFYQKTETQNDEYLKEFKARVESINNFDACILRKLPCLVKKKLKKIQKNWDSNPEWSKCMQRNCGKRGGGCPDAQWGWQILLWQIKKHLSPTHVHGDKSIPLHCWRDDKYSQHL